MKLYSILYKVSAILKQKGLYYELKSHIGDDCYIKKMTERDRCMGKTHTLMKLSAKYKIPVLEPNIALKYDFQNEYEKAIVISPNDLRGKRYEVVLIDEIQLLSNNIINILDEREIKYIGIITKYR